MTDVLLESTPTEAQETNVKTATCSKCNETKPVTDFNKDNSKKSGLRSQCRTCQRSTDRTRRRNDPTSTPGERAEARKLAAARQRAKDAAADERARLRQEAHRQAILRLIERHRSEFDRLVYSEQIRAGVINLDDRPRENWVSLI